jgi:hypothetical protein
VETFHVSIIDMLPAPPFQEVHVTSVIGASINQHLVALGIVRIETQQNAFLSVGLEVSLLQLIRQVDQDLATPDPEVLHTWFDSSQQLPRHSRCST